jgi:hypothetical protein
MNPLESLARNLIAAGHKDRAALVERWEQSRWLNQQPEAEVEWEGENEGESQDTETA